MVNFQVVSDILHPHKIMYPLAKYYMLFDMIAINKAGARLLSTVLLALLHSS